MSPLDERINPYQSIGCISFEGIAVDRRSTRDAFRVKMKS
jgi:hypothetical protein